MSVDQGNVLASASPEAISLYRALLAALRPLLGEFQVEVKKTSVHLARQSAFAGVHFRRKHLIVTIKAASPIASPRIVKVEQVSKNRWHCEVKLASGVEVDGELKAWIKDAYTLCA